ncbi:clusterin-associated protein 1-like [Centruroides sculpturatus]|uniref:clusterin-associated protein 1-like n=1 Tax=Centruroides sculpturatus TaxID=218467 RepID=UPI000C6D2C20|nr:clusterin-associated protein 1-like [Centruroides sculpturatus]
MSFRELRSFTEMMRALGYPRLISMENFRNPNFLLVAEILQWLVKRYDPNIEVPSEIDTEQDRVIFIKSIAQIMVTKANIKLNTKKLYMADGYAVKELLKISTLLYEAMRTKAGNDLDSSGDEGSLNVNFDLSTKLADLKLTRQLASDITIKGASLYDLLAKEIDLRDKRSLVLAKQHEITEIEKELRNCIKAVEEEIQKTHQMIENVASDEANLEAKIEKKKIELERNQKRFQTLKSVRPAFMDEYEKLEKELEAVYNQYLVKFRCLAFLEQQLEELEKAEQEQMEEREQQIKKMVEKLREEELLRSDATSNLDDITIAEGDNIDINENMNKEKPKRPQPGASGLRRDVGRRVFGSMTGADKDDSLESDSDLDLEGEDDDGSDVSDGELDLMTLGDRKPVIPQHSLPDSDNDF